MGNAVVRPFPEPPRVFKSPGVLLRGRKGEGYRKARCADGRGSVAAVGADSMCPPARPWVGHDAEVGSEDPVHSARVSSFGDQAASQFGEPRRSGVIREVRMRSDDQVTRSDSLVLGRQAAGLGADRRPRHRKNCVNGSLQRGERSPSLAQAVFTPWVYSGAVASGISERDHPLTCQQPFGVREVGVTGGGGS
jgi:hypothetical protein